MEPANKLGVSGAYALTLSSCLNVHLQRAGLIGSVKVYAGALYICRFVPAGQLILCFHTGCNV